MPLKLNVGLSKKVGLPDYGSLGASCNVEVELDAHLMARDPSGFQQQVRQAFDACSQAVQEELARQVPSHGPANSPSSSGNGQANGHGNGPSNGRPSERAATGEHRNGRSRSNNRRATASQVRAIFAISNRQKRDLSQELQNRFGVDRPEDMSIGDASKFIDELQAMSEGAGGSQ